MTVRIMIDDPPYIIVDNQRLDPIFRSAEIEPPSSKPPDQGEAPFGVVERVTISKAALERYRQYQSAATANPQNMQDSSKSDQVTVPVRLSILPKNGP